MVLTGLGVVGLGSLGSACVGQSPVPTSQIYQYATKAGFPVPVAVQMTAIALRESGGCADGHYQGATGASEDSYGLWQINWPAHAQQLASIGITDPAQLYDPATAARAAYAIYGGNPANLDAAWAINSDQSPAPGRPTYAQAYQRYLPQAQQAAIDAGVDPAADTGTGTDWGTLAGVGALALLGLMLVKR